MQPIWIIIAAILGGGIGLGLGFLIRFSIKKRQVNQQLKQEEANLSADISRKQQQLQLLERQCNDGTAGLQRLIEEFNTTKEKQQQEINSLNIEYTKLITGIQALKDEQDRTIEANKKAAKEVEILAMQTAANNIEQRVKELTKQYEEYEKQYHDDMIVMMQDAVKRYQDITTNAQLEADHATQSLNDLRARINVIVENNKRDAQEAAKCNFYRLQLSDQDIAEIEKIRSIESYLRSAEPLNKVIWKVYYEKPTNDLIGRVLGANKRTGIYKITSLDTKMCYVGQSVDIAERWKQHIKRGIGAEAPTRNKLYPAMLKAGVENFTFELLEECPIQALNAREDYWQEVYHAIDFGYSIK